MSGCHGNIQKVADDPRLADEYVQWAEASGEPVLLSGLLRSWPAVKLWRGPTGLERLRKLAGGAEVQVCAWRRLMQQADRDALPTSSLKRHLIPPGLRSSVRAPRRSWCPPPASSTGTSHVTSPQR
jgi:hypothetical protein